MTDTQSCSISKAPLEAKTKEELLINNLDDFLMVYVDDKLLLKNQKIPDDAKKIKINDWEGHQQITWFLQGEFRREETQMKDLINQTRLEKTQIEDNIEHYKDFDLRTTTHKLKISTNNLSKNTVAAAAAFTDAQGNWKKVFAKILHFKHSEEICSRRACDVEENHRELEISSLLLQGDFPHIVGVVGILALKDNKGYCIVMERYDTDLNTLIRQTTIVNKEVPILKMARGVIEALKNLSKYSIYHNDIKPQNIFYKRRNNDARNNTLEDRELSGDFFLGDFGAASWHNLENYSLTLAYSPIEKKNKMDSDLWSLGITILRSILGVKVTISSENLKKGQIRMYLEKTTPTLVLLVVSICTIGGIRPLGYSGLEEIINNRLNDPNKSDNAEENLARSDNSQENLARSDNSQENIIDDDERTVKKSHIKNRGVIRGGSYHFMRIAIPDMIKYLQSEGRCRRELKNLDRILSKLSSSGDMSLVRDEFPVRRELSLEREYDQRYCSYQHLGNLTNSLAWIVSIVPAYLLL